MTCDTLFTLGWPPRKESPAWLTIGNFDGVHLGHQALIRELISLARKDQVLSTLVSFWPNPKVFFSQEKNFYLTPNAEKTGYLSRLGVDEVATLDFNQKMANMEAETFFYEIKRHVNLKGIVVGKNFALGRGRKGTPDLLAKLCEKNDIRFIVFPQLMLKEKPVSSTRIRSALNAGKVDEAALLLGRPYQLCSRVIDGEHIGRSIGVPTANLHIDPDKYLPRKGVYASIAHIRDEKYMAVTNVGVRPTFGSHFKVTVETIVLDFNDDIYGEELRVEFIRWLRPEEKFHSVQALVNQIEKDKTVTRRIFENGFEQKSIQTKPNQI